jgi:hypothetical protein
VSFADCSIAFHSEWLEQCGGAQVPIASLWGFPPSNRLEQVIIIAKRGRDGNGQKAAWRIWAMHRKTEGPNANSFFPLSSNCPRFLRQGFRFRQAVLLCLERAGTIPFLEFYGIRT